MGITIKDVAAVAQVSPATVSRFLTGNAKVAPETAEQIRAVIEELGYQPDHVARALRQKRTHLLGYVAPNLNRAGAVKLLAALERESAANGFLIAVTSTQGQASIESERIVRLVAQGIDGLFLLPISSTENQALIASTIEDGIPVVQLGEKIEGASGDFVGVDYMAGMDAIVRHLVRHDHAHISFIGQGAIDYTGEAQIRAITEVVRNRSDVALRGIKVGGQTAEFGRQSTLALMPQTDRPNAIICGNELIASGAIQALKQLDIASSDAAVVAFGDTPPSGETWPNFTLAALPYADMAQEAIRIMLQRISGLTVEPLQIGITPNLQVGNLS